MDADFARLAAAAADGAAGAAAAAEAGVAAAALPAAAADPAVAGVASSLSSLGFDAPTAQNPKLLDSIQYLKPVLSELLSAIQPYNTPIS